MPARFELHRVGLEERRGPANARNEGIGLARAPIVLFVGDDIIPSDDFVRHHLAAHARHTGEHWAVLGRTTWPPDLPTNSLMKHVDGVGAQQFGYLHMRDGQIMDFRHFYTSNLSVKTEFLRRARPWFDTGFPYPAYEDTELGYRLFREQGLRIVYSDRPRAFHYHYYTARTFATRQYRCGQMAIVLARKHPALAGPLLVSRVDQCLALAGNTRFRDAGSLPDPAALEELCLALAGTCEFYEGPLVDELYRVLLEYFVVKGMIDEALAPREAERATEALASVALAHHAGALAAELNGVLPNPSDELTLPLVHLAETLEKGFIRAGLLRDRHFRRVRYVVVPGY
jgi:hypothetical protein